MFKSSEMEGENVYSNNQEDTVIGSSIKIEGDLVSNGSVLVEGEVSGTLKTEKSLKVGERAKVVADVKAKDAIISGKVQGNLEISDKIELSSTAEVNGDIKTGSLVIAAGAVFNGKCEMTEISQPAPTQEKEVEEEEEE